MAETKHTPGPYEAADRGDYRDFHGNCRVILGDDKRIAIVFHNGTEEEEATTNLFVAAPEMYEALKASTKSLIAERDTFYDGISDENGEIRYGFDREELARTDALINANQAILAKSEGQ